MQHLTPASLNALPHTSHSTVIYGAVHTINIQTDSETKGRRGKGKGRIRL